MAKRKSETTTKKKKRSGKKKKTIKDPNAPKRPKPAFFMYSDEYREKLKKENPDMKMGEISKTLGKMWKELDEKEKEVSF